MEAWQLVTTIVIAYCVVCLGLGFVAGRRLKRSLEDFFVLSRTAGLLVIFLSVAATYHSAFAFLTSVAVFAKAGVSFWIASMAWTTLAAVFGYYYGRRVFLLGKARGYITPADLLADYYGSEGIRVVTALVMALFIVAYVVVQAIGLGIILSIASGGHVPYELASLALVLVAVAYTILGGLRAAYWTDVLQGVWMYIGVWAAALAITFTFFPGGLPELFRAVGEVDEKLLVMRWSPDLLLSFMLVYSMGLMLLPHLWTRYYAARDTWTIKWSSVLTAAYLSSYYLPAMMVGLTAAVLDARGVPGLLEPGFIGELVKAYGSRDAVMAFMIYRFTPPLLAGFLLAGAAAAAMSTLDSLVGATSQVLTRDIYQRYIRPGASERELVLVGRIIIAVLAVVGWLLAVTRPGLIFDITAIACAGGLQFLPATLQAIKPTKRCWIGTRGALAGIVVGSLATALLSSKIGGKLGFPITFHPAEAGVIGLALNTLTAVIATRILGEEHPPLHRVFREVLGEG